MSQDIAVREGLQEAGIRVVQTPYNAPNANAHAERFVRSLKEECLDGIIPIGERHFRPAIEGNTRAVVAHPIARRRSATDLQPDRR